VLVFAGGCDFVVRASVDTTGGDPDSGSFDSSISGDGRYVAFASRATDLVVGGGSAVEDIFVRDLKAGTTTRVTVDTGSGDANANTRHARISADGRHVVFASPASDLVSGEGNGSGAQCRRPLRRVPHHREQLRRHRRHQRLRRLRPRGVNAEDRIDRAELRRAGKLGHAHGDRNEIPARIGHAADVAADALAAKIVELPNQLRRSLIWDQGKEMAAHARFSVKTSVPVYFCDPRGPWQRGSNENTNGLLRQYFPKRTEIANYSQADLDDVAAQLNDRPRQTLGWRSPSQALDEALR
jgi:hypothetical protein